MSIDEADCLAEEDLSDEALEGNPEDLTPAEREAAMERRWGATGFQTGAAELQRVGAADMAKLEAMSAETEAILRENAETRADLGLDVPPKDDRIEDEAGLMRAFASLRRATRALAQNQRMQAPVLEEARRELAALEARCAEANAALEARAEHHRNRIEVYARTHRDELVRGRRKTRDFGIGSVSFRAAGGEYRWRKDMKPAEREAVLLAWALDFQKHVEDVALTVPVQKPDVDAIKHVLTLMSQDNGETAEAPGLEYVPEHEELTVKVEG